MRDSGRSERWGRCLWLTSCSLLIWLPSAKSPLAWELLETPWVAKAGLGSTAERTSWKGDRPDPRRSANQILQQLGKVPRSLTFIKGSHTQRPKRSWLGCLVGKTRNRPVGSKRSSAWLALLEPLSALQMASSSMYLAARDLNF